MPDEGESQTSQGRRNVKEILRTFALRMLEFCHLERQRKIAKLTHITTHAILRCTQNDCKMRGEVRITSRKAAFTLTEVLITLGIIGVVAALTLPNVITKFQQKTFATAFKKEYSNLNNAINMVIYEHDAKECYQTVIYNEHNQLIYSANTSDCYALKSGIISKLNLTKINYTLADYYRDFTNRLKDGGVTVNPSVAYLGILSNLPHVAYLSQDGAIFIFYYSKKVGSGYFEIPFIVDVNGRKGPNKWGYDVFWLSLVKTNEGVRLSDEYATLSEKGGSLPRNILLNKWSNDYNKDVSFGVWK